MPLWGNKREYVYRADIEPEDSMFFETFKIIRETQEELIQAVESIQSKNSWQPYNDSYIEVDETDSKVWYCQMVRKRRELWV